MCLVHVRAMAAGLVSGGVLLMLGTQGIANAAPLARAASPVTSKNCVQVAAATSSPGTPTQTPTTPASQASNPAQSNAPTQPPAGSSSANAPASANPSTAAPSSASPSSSSTAKPSTTPAQTTSATPATATLSAFFATPAASASPSPSTSATSSSPAPVPELCVSVTQPPSSIQRGQAGTFTVQVSSENWTVSDNVTVQLQTQPASITPAFTTQDAAVCKPAAATSPVECTMPVPTTQAQTLQIQVPVAATATSVTQVALKAVALPETAKLAGSLSAAEIAQVTAAPATKKQTSPAATSSSPAKRNSDPLGPVGNGSFAVGQLPELNGAGSSVIGVGNASNLFPRISPSAAPSPVPGANGGKKANADPPAKLSLLPLGMPVMTAQIIGLIALAVAFLLALTRLSLRRSARPRR